MQEDFGIRRGAFLAGMGGAAVLAPTLVQANTILRPSFAVPKPSMSTLLKRAGYVSVLDRPNALGQRTLYKASGASHTFARGVSPSECVEGEDCGPTISYTYDNFSFQGTIAGQTIIGMSEPAKTIIYNLYWAEITEPVFGVGTTPESPVYDVGPLKPECIVAGGALFQSACSAAAAILKNPQWGQTAMTAAGNFLNRWGGVGAIGPVGAAIAAGIEFISAAIAVLSAPEWLIIAGTVVGVSTAIYGYYRCLSS